MEVNDHRPDIQVDQRIFFRALGTTYKVLSKSVNGSAAIIEHTVEPKSIGAPMHKHTHEDEFPMYSKASFQLFRTEKCKLQVLGSIS